MSDSIWILLPSRIWSYHATWKNIKSPNITMAREQIKIFFLDGNYQPLHTFSIISSKGKVEIF